MNAPRPLNLLSLPDELLIYIMTFAMASESPVYLWLFPGLSTSNPFLKALRRKTVHKDLIPSWKNALPVDQREHWLDWITATGICQQIRTFGLPTFFQQKPFVIPRTMLQEMRTGELRRSYFDIARQHIRRVIVTIDSIGDCAEFLHSPQYHHFTQLRSLIVWTPSTPHRAVTRYVYLRDFPRAIPDELAGLLCRLGWKVEVRLLLVATNEVNAGKSLEDVRHKLGLILRMAVQQEAEHGEHGSP